VTVPKTIAAQGLLSPTEVSKLLDVHRSTVWLWINNGMLKATAHGHFRAVSPDGVKKFLQSYRPPNGITAATLDEELAKLKAGAKRAAKNGKKRASRKGKGSR
jgi:excisionase family DNA binding protein